MDEPESDFPKDLFRKIEKATTTPRPFYDNIYFLFSISRVCNYVEELRKLGTVAVVELHSFFGRNNAENFTDLLNWNRYPGERRFGGTGV